MATTSTGYGTLLTIDTDGGGSTVKVAFEGDCSLKIDLDTVENTNKDSVNVKGYHTGSYGWSISASGYIDSQAGGDTTGINVLRAAMLTPAYLEFSMTESGTSVVYSGDFICTSLGFDYPPTGMAAWSMTGLGNGALTPS